MNDIELLGQHASRLRAQLEQLDTRVGADARTRLSNYRMRTSA